MAQFELVSKYTDTSLLPSRSTKDSAGYDFKVAEDIVIPPYNFMLQAMKDTAAVAEFIDLDQMKLITKSHKIQPTLVPTGVKCKLDPQTYLQISVRSSCPLNYWLILANGVGIIDRDYYDNQSTEGEIFFQLINLSPYYIKLRKGDKIGQGIILPYKLVNNEIIPEATRIGGFGSTSFSFTPEVKEYTTSTNPEVICGEP